MTRTVPPDHLAILFSLNPPSPNPFSPAHPKNVTDSFCYQACRPKQVVCYSSNSVNRDLGFPEANQTSNSNCELGWPCTTQPSHSPFSPLPLAPAASPSLRPCTPPSPDPQTVRLALSATGTLLSLLSNPGQARRRMPPPTVQHSTQQASTRPKQIKIKRDSSLPSAGTPDSIQCSAQPGFCDKKATSPLNARSSLGHRHNAQKSISTILPFWYSS